MKLEINTTPQAIRILELLAQYGIYGADREDVARRFVEKELEKFIDQPKFEAINGSSRIK